MTDEQLLSAAGILLDRDPALASVHVDGTSLRFQRCEHCGYRRYPAARFCPECLSCDARWATDDGLGAVWSFAVYRRAFDPAFAAALPYNVALVELASGPRLITNVLGVPPAGLRVGLPVRAVPREVRPDRYLIYAEVFE